MMKNNDQGETMYKSFLPGRTNNFDKSVFYLLMILDIGEILKDIGGNF